MGKLCVGKGKDVRAEKEKESSNHVFCKMGGDKEAHGWLQIPAPQLCFESHHGSDFTLSDDVVLWFSPPSGIPDNSCLYLIGCDHYPTGCIPHFVSNTF